MDRVPTEMYRYITQDITDTKSFNDICYETGEYQGGDCSFCEYRFDCSGWEERE